MRQRQGTWHRQVARPMYDVFVFRMRKAYLKLLSRLLHVSIRSRALGLQEVAHVEAFALNAHARPTMRIMVCKSMGVWIECVAKASCSLSVNANGEAFAVNAIEDTLNARHWRGKGRAERVRSWVGAILRSVGLSYVQCRKEYML